MSISEIFIRESRNALQRFEDISKEFQSPTDIEKQRVILTKNIIKRYLPRIYSVGNGEIIDSLGNKTGQVDIVICNQYHPFTFTESEPGIFFSEGVSCAIEVKPDLGNYDELERGLLQVQRIKKLNNKPIDADITIGNEYQHEKMNKILTVIFGYNSPKLNRLLVKVRELYDELQILPLEQFDMLVCLNNGIIYNIKDVRDELHIEIAGKRALGLVAHQTDEYTFEQFLFHLSKIMPRILRMTPIINIYTGVLSARTPDKFII